MKNQLLILAATFAAGILFTFGLSKVTGIQANFENVTVVENKIVLPDVPQWIVVSTKGNGYSTWAVLERRIDGKLETREIEHHVAENPFQIGQKIDVP